MNKYTPDCIGLIPFSQKEKQKTLAQFHKIFWHYIMNL